MEINHLPTKLFTILRQYSPPVSHLIINIFRCPLCDIIQIVTSVSILSCFMPFLEYRDNDFGIRTSSYSYILGRALNRVEYILSHYFHNLYC